MKNMLSLSLLICTVLISCKTPDTAKKSSSKAKITLVGPKWVLTKLNGDVVNLTSPDLEQPYIILSEEDNNVGGNGGCNSFGGSYTLSGEKTISFSQMRATMMYCEDHGIEAVFMSNLQKATTYVIDKKELTFKDENGYILASFKPLK